MDSESLLISDPARERSYRQMGEVAQRQAVAEYREQLQNALLDPALAAIPTTFDMVRTTYDTDEGTVVMDLRFQEVGFTEVKRYTYFLRREDRVWYIYDYAVVNLGSE